MLAASRASAHAPLPRAVSEGELALSLPGFGVVVGNEGRYAYACDALLRLPASDTPPAMVRRPDGTLLLGTLAGMRGMSAQGCPIDVELADRPVYALAASGTTMFAFAGDGVWRHQGTSWEQRSPYASGGQITSLIVAEGVLYATRGASVLVSKDEGASFEVTLTERALTLLAADSGGLWAMARAQGATGNRGFEVVRARAAEGPWRSLLTVNYFGGLTVDASGAVWVGDEGGGLYRSLDGETFSNVAPTIYPSCLRASGTRVLSCNEDLPSQPVLFDVSTPVFKLDDVTQMVACEGVEARCAAAWVEWQRDVLLRPILPDGTFADASVPDASVADASVADAGVTDASVVDARVADASRDEAGADGCALATGDTSWLSLALLALAARRRRS